MLNSKFSIRLERGGRYNFSLYNIVVVKTKQKHSSKYYQKIGVYVPLYANRFFFINMKDLAFWLSRGAVVKGSLIKLLLSLLKFK
jgi:ribosomal protein S16